MLTSTQQELIAAIKDCLKHGHVIEARETIHEQVQDCYRSIRWYRTSRMDVPKNIKEYLRQLKRL